MARHATLLRRRRAATSPTAALAVVGGRLLTGLRDVTSDLSALDSKGFWAVVMSFEGATVCARFDRIRRARPWPGPAWEGPGAHTWRTSLDRDAFMAGVSAIRDGVSRGDVYQVNLCRVLSAPLPAGADVAALGARLARDNPAPYSAVVRIPSHDIHVASASPERFINRRGDLVQSRPIKGTARHAAGFTAKDQAENVMIVDLVRNDLGRVCEPGSVKVDALCEVEAHPGLHHLVSTVSGKLRPDQGWAQLIAATFPPGSVTGAPKNAALGFISRLEPVQRGPYCGAVGWVDADNREGDLNVAIRTFWVAENRLHFGTGGAITWGSTPEGEWAETELKAHRLLTLASSPDSSSDHGMPGTPAGAARPAQR